MSLDVDRERAARKRMETAELHARDLELFGEPTYPRHKERLIRRILWRLQARLEGDLSDRARRRAAELADDSDLRLAPPEPKRARGTSAPLGSSGQRRLPSPGVVPTHRSKGRPLEVTVLQDGFAFEGGIFTSWSAAAKQITGSPWNGWHFFGVASNGGAA